MGERAILKPPRAKEGDTMTGFITKVEVIRNADWIIKTWGMAFYIACLDAEDKTFLQLLVERKKI